MNIKMCKFLTIISIIMFSLVACGKNEEPLPLTVPDRAEQKLSDILDKDRKALVTLYENPSVTQATIENNLYQNYYGEDIYRIDLEQAAASIRDPDGIVLEYSLDETQVEQLNQLLSKYALTIYDDKPYWPTGDYCTMVQLFEFDIKYNDGYYREYGATHYPVDWDEFIQELKELITNEQEPQETEDVITGLRQTSKDDINYSRKSTLTNSLGYKRG